MSHSRTFGSLTVKLANNPPNSLQVKLPFFLLLHNNSFLLGFAQIISQHKIDWQSEDWQDDCPYCITPTPVDMEQKFCCSL